MTRTVLIAETDENGAIAWVWRFGPHDRIAHPLDEHRHASMLLPTLMFLEPAKKQFFVG
jgi:hypothetical protein